MDALCCALKHSLMSTVCTLLPDNNPTMQHFELIFFKLHPSLMSQRLSQNNLHHVLFLFQSLSALRTVFNILLTKLLLNWLQNETSDSDLPN